MPEPQGRDVPGKRDLPGIEDSSVIEELPRIEDLPGIELSKGKPARLHDAGGESLEDEIFAMASTVEVEDASRAEPLLGSWRVPSARPSRTEAGRALAGFLTFSFVDVIMMYAPLMMSRRPSLLPQMVTLLVLAFGLGGLLAWKVRGAWRPFGFGMMLAWVFLTLVSLGLLTGVTP